MDKGYVPTGVLAGLSWSEAVSVQGSLNYSNTGAIAQASATLTPLINFDGTI